MTIAFASGQCLTIMGPGRSEIIIYSREVTADDVQQALNNIEAGFNARDFVTHRKNRGLVTLRLFHQLCRQVIKPLAIFISMLRRQGF